MHNALAESASIAVEPLDQRRLADFLLEGQYPVFCRCGCGVTLGGEDRIDDRSGAGVVGFFGPEITAEPLAVGLILSQHVIDALACVLAVLKHAEVGSGDASCFRDAVGLCLLPGDAMNVVEIKSDHAPEWRGWVVLAQVRLCGFKSLLLVGGQVADVHACVVGLGLGAELGLGVTGTDAKSPERVEPGLVASADAKVCDLDEVAVGVGKDDHMM